MVCEASGVDCVGTGVAAGVVSVMGVGRAAAGVAEMVGAAGVAGAVAGAGGEYLAMRGAAGRETPATTRGPLPARPKDRTGAGSGCGCAGAVAGAAGEAIGAIGAIGAMGAAESEAMPGSGVGAYCASGRACERFSEGWRKACMTEAVASDAGGAVGAAACVMEAETAGGGAETVSGAAEVSWSFVAFM